jgi:plastocyanin
MTRLLFATAVLFGLSVTASLASELHEVTLEDGAISTVEINAKVGDIVQIIHKDNDGLHALFLEDAAHKFDLSKMKHGEHFDLTLKHSGTLNVKCHQMNNMSLIINVTE